MSEAHPELAGAWFRAFDYERWENWASDRPRVRVRSTVRSTVRGRVRSTEY